MRIFCICFYVLLTAEGIAQALALPAYNEFISGIMQNHPLAKRAANEGEYGKLQLKAARGNFDPVLNGGLDQKRLNGIDYYTGLSAELKQPLFTNQYLKAGYEYGRGVNINPERYTPLQGLPFLGVELGLLQGLLIDERRAEVMKARFYADYYTAGQQVRINELLFEASQRYFDWLFTAKQVALNDFFMEAARRRLQGIEALAEAGERAAVDTVEAALLFQSRLLELQSARMEIQNSTNALNAAIWQDNRSSANAGDLMAGDSLEHYYEKARTALSANLDAGGLDNPVLSRYDAYQKVLNVDVRLKKEKLKPVLNVKYNLLSSGGLQAEGFGTDNSYRFGLNVSFPLFFRNPAGDYRMAKLVAGNNNLELQNRRNELAFSLNAVKQTVSVLSEQLANAERTVNYSRMLLEAEKLRFDSGESSLFLLNMRENKLLESELKLAGYRLKFIKTVLQLIYLNGNLAYRL